MSELPEIKARAAELPTYHPFTEAWKELCDRAIAIAEITQNTLDIQYDHLNRTYIERDEARTEANELLAQLRKVSSQREFDLAEELEKARAAALLLRDALMSHMPRFDIEHKALSATEWLEDFR